MRILSVVAVAHSLGAAASSADARSIAADAPARFETLKKLAGTWRATRADGRSVDMSIRQTAGGTALVETWTLSPTRESMTVYHLDGRDLLATHYCPIGNQPRLRLDRTGADPRQFGFTFKDATNVRRGEAHQHAFALDLTTPDRIVRTETYRQGRVLEQDRLVFARVPAA